MILPERLGDRVRSTLAIVAAAFLLAGCTSDRHAMAPAPAMDEPESFYLPNAEGARVVSVATNGVVVADVVLQTQRAAVKETGPKESVAHFGEVYAFSPTFIAVHRDEPTRFRIWNLQPDDQHTFMLVDPRMNVLMKAALPPVKETAFIFTFHEEGLFTFHCGVHQPGMNGQILVLPRRTNGVPSPP